MRNRSKIYWTLGLAAAALLLLTGWTAQRFIPESAPVARGAAYAQVRGCVECHGDPENLHADSNVTGCSDTNQLSWHPQYNVNCTDVLAYFETVRLRRSIDARIKISKDNPLASGEFLARKYHCFNCHGHMGQGGFNNSKSLKGYIPGYFGADFRSLTRNANPDSVRQWIMYGVDQEMLQKPITGRIAKYFFDRQAVSMPSFKSLDPVEIETLVYYVISLNQYGPMTADTVRSYARTSKSKSMLLPLKMAHQ
jgi:mono/diheme cytochrome c family protein